MGSLTTIWAIYLFKNSIKSSDVLKSAVKWGLEEASPLKAKQQISSIYYLVLRQLWLEFHDECWEQDFLFAIDISNLK